MTRKKRRKSPKSERILIEALTVRVESLERTLSDTLNVVRFMLDKMTESPDKAPDDE